ncbi:MAG TPA: Ig-like domain-containing protein [Flavobacteriales bacterium]|nr:Ig-like domain-containing protein [Flavobacteriales bacterium]
MRLHHAALAAVFIASLFGSCRKDKDERPPVVEILLPVPGTTIAIPDTILVRVQVSDDHQLTGLAVELLNVDGAVVGSAGTINLDGSTGTYERTLVITDERLPTGTYTIAARATDGTNDGRAFRQVNILEAPLRLLATFLAPPFTLQQTTIDRLAPDGTSTPFETVQDFNGIAVNSRSGHLVVAGARYDPLQALPAAPGATPWQVQPTTTDQDQQFTAVTVDPGDGQVFFASRDGRIRGFTGQGSGRFNAQCLVDHRCEAIVTMGDEVVTWQTAIVGGAHRVVTYTPAGTILDQLPLQEEHVAWFERSADQLLHFANVDGSGLIEELNIQQGGSPDLRSFPGEPIRHVVRLNANLYIVALQERLMRFDHATHVATELRSGFPTDALAYDPVNGALLAAQGGELLTVDPTTGATVASMGTSGTIGHILPLYNR